MKSLLSHSHKISLHPKSYLAQCFPDSGLIAEQGYSDKCSSPQRPCHLNLARTVDPERLHSAPVCTGQKRDTK